MERPENTTEEQLDFLDELRDSGVTNMWGAGEYLENEYPELTEKEAGKILLYWMDTYPRDAWHLYGLSVPLGITFKRD